MADVWMLSQPVKTTGCERIKARQRLKAGNGHGNYLRFVHLFVFAFLFFIIGIVIYRRSENPEAKCCGSDQLVSDKTIWCRARIATKIYS